VASLADETFTRRQMMAALLAAGAPGATVAPDPADQPDEDALPLPESGRAPPPLVNAPPPKGYSPPYGPPPYGPRSHLALALAGSAAAAPSDSMPSGPPPPRGSSGAAKAPAASWNHFAAGPGAPLLIADNQVAGPPRWQSFQRHCALSWHRPNPRRPRPRRLPLLRRGRSTAPLPAGIRHKMRR
jgi:hypothetical protein